MALINRNFICKKLIWIYTRVRARENPSLFFFFSFFDIEVYAKQLYFFYCHSRRTRNCPTRKLCFRRNVYANTKLNTNYYIEYIKNYIFSPVQREMLSLDIYIYFFSRKGIFTPIDNPLQRNTANCRRGQADGKNLVSISRSVVLPTPLNGDDVVVISLSRLYSHQEIVAVYTATSGARLVG